MMRALKQKPTLDRPATYQVQVPGELDESWSDWVAAMTITVECEGEELPVTTLTGTIDQAAPALFLGLAIDLGQLYRGPASHSVLNRPERI